MDREKKEKTKQNSCRAGSVNGGGAGRGRETGRFGYRPIRGFHSIIHQNARVWEAHRHADGRLGRKGALPLGCKSAKFTKHTEKAKRAIGNA